jgi:hypothetical protein
MSSQTTKARLREENATMAALLKRATGEPLTAEDREILVEVAKHAALERRLRETYTLEGAIEKCLRGAGQSPGPGLPAHEAEVAKASGDTVSAAIAKAFDGTRTATTNELAGRARDGVIEHLGTAADVLKSRNAKPDAEAEAREAGIKKFRKNNPHLYPEGT